MANGWGDVESRTGKGCGHLGNQFLTGIGFGFEPPALIAVKPFGVASPVTQFVKECAVIIYLFGECRLRWQLHKIAQRVVKGFIPTMANIGTTCPFSPLRTEPPRALACLKVSQFCEVKP